MRQDAHETRSMDRGRKQLEHLRTGVDCSERFSLAVAKPATTWRPRSTAWRIRNGFVFGVTMKAHAERGERVDIVDTQDGASADRCATSEGVDCRGNAVDQPGSRAEPRSHRSLRRSALHVLQPSPGRMPRRIAISGRRKGAEAAASAVRGADAAIIVVQLRAAAIDQDVGSVDESRLVAGEEQRGMGDSFRRPGALERSSSIFPWRLSASTTRAQSLADSGRTIAVDPDHPRTVLREQPGGAAPIPLAAPVTIAILPVDVHSLDSVQHEAERPAAARKCFRQIASSLPASDADDSSSAIGHGLNAG